MYRFKINPKDYHEILFLKGNFKEGEDYWTEDNNFESNIKIKKISEFKKQEEIKSYFENEFNIKDWITTLT